MIAAAQPRPAIFHVFDAATNVIQNEVNNPDDCEIITGVFMDEELGDELIVATVATGMNDQAEDKVIEIETSTNDQPEEFLTNYNNLCLSKGMLDSSDISGTLIYLLSDMSKFLNGQNIVVDDGFTL